MEWAHYFHQLPLPITHYLLPSLSKKSVTIRVFRSGTINVQKNIWSQTSEVLETSEVFSEIIYLKNDIYSLEE